MSALQDTRPWTSLVEPDFKQVTCSRTINTDTFNSGVQSFRFNIPHGFSASPKKSYMAQDLQLRLIDVGGGFIQVPAPTIASGVATAANAFCENPCASLIIVLKSEPLETKSVM